MILPRTFSKVNHFLLSYLYVIDGGLVTRFVINKCLILLTLSKYANKRERERERKKLPEILKE